MAHVVVRADAGTRVGAGHVVRCTSLARALVERGAQVTLVGRMAPQLADRIRAAGAEAVPLDADGPGATRSPGEIWDDAEQAADAALTRERAGAADVTVVDHYGLDARWERAAPSDAVVVVDDLANRSHHCVAVVDHNWYGPGTGDRYSAVAPGARLLLGPRYALLQREYRDLRTRPGGDPNWPPRRVLVSFGGTDATGETTKAVRALTTPDTPVAVDVVVGSPDRVTDELRRLADGHPAVALHVAVPSLAPLLARADLAIGASGAATWERLCLDVPAVVATTTESQSGVTAALHRYGLTTWLGLSRDTTTASYRDAVTALAGGPRPATPPLVDGWGADRVALAVCGLIGAPTGDVTVAPSTVADVPVVLGVAAEAERPATEPVTGGVFGDPSGWEAERAEHLAAVAAGRRFTVSVGGCPVGYVDAGRPAGVLLDRSAPSRTAPAAAALVRQPHRRGRPG